ncbi:MAG: sigma-54-dependent Fis family transcriptional regulator [Desulfobacterales bacterium]|nr:sigma-54-dependent Fis family transcriptional regulator [Desulfobacterales bacterium]
MQTSILIVDDEQDMLQLLKRSLAPELNCRIQTATSGESALKIYSESTFDLVLADIKMPGMNGLELLELIKRNNRDQTVVMMTAYGEIDMAVLTMKSGAYDFITKPFELETLVLRLKKALERTTLLKDNLRLKKECFETAAFHNMAGNSREIQRVYETIRTVAKTDLTVLITGESGTGKEISAKAIHALSHRNQQPYVAVNCPTIPENILESELFGYKKGAFTHATQNKIGLFQEAHHGTIFLDEIGDISPAMQTKLLRVIQEKEIKPLGDTKSVQVDIRIVASTNQNLREKMDKKEFREDLFYRLNVLPLKLPPLRDRKEDIPLIANYLLEKHCAKLDRPLKSLSTELLETMQTRMWKGNIRELENFIIRGIMFSETNDISSENVGITPSTHVKVDIENKFMSLSYKEAKDGALIRFNTEFIENLLSQWNGNITHAAKVCGLERQALQQIMKRYEIKAGKFKA